jgi:hypothetical protein
MFFFVFVICLYCRDTLNHDFRSSLETTIIQWIVTHATNRDNRVVRKLSTTLSLFYLYNVDMLGTSLRKLVQTCLAVDPSSHSDLALPDFNKNDLSALSPQLFVMILMYITSLSDEAGRMMSIITPQYAINLHFFLSSSSSFSSLFLPRLRRPEYTPSCWNSMQSS